MAVAIWLYLKSIIPNLKNQGNIDFELELKGDGKIKGFVHGFSMREVRRLFYKSGLNIIESFIIGYDSGFMKKHKWQGQYFIVAKKGD